MTEPSSEQSEKQLKQISRRNFLYAGGAAAAVGTAGLVASRSMLGNSIVKAAGGTGVRYGMVIDLQRCFGCRSCMQACKVENNTPGGINWMYVFRFEEGVYPNTTTRYMPRPCMHCGNAPCVKVCPVGARYKQDDGLVAMDRNRCIGCRYCQVACPYRVNYFNWEDPKKNQYYDWYGDEGYEWDGDKGEALRSVMDGANPPYKNPDLEKKYGKKKRHIAGSGFTEGITEKCTFCVHRLAKGLKPACVANCPANVFHFGDLNDPDSEVSKLLVVATYFRLGEHLDTQPSVYYIGGAPPGKEAHQIDYIKGRDPITGRS